jgi:hypothetical protein
MILHYTDNDILSTALSQVGWVPMVTGFSFVLYSRLHLLNPRKQTLRVILTFITVDAVLFHGPVVVSTIIGNVHFSPTIGRVFDIASFTEIAFSVQETTLAGFYIYLFLQFTKDSRKEPSTKATLRLLLMAESVVFSVDIVLNVLLYKKLYLPRSMIQAFSSILKLKIEFIVLNALVKYAHAKSRNPVLRSWTDGGDTLASPSPILVSPSRRSSKFPTAVELQPGHNGAQTPSSIGRTSSMHYATSPELV